MPHIRPYRPEDLDALYDICLKTGDSGRDGSHLYQNPRILGEIYAAPYAVLRPHLAFVVEDEQGVGGYVLGAEDTRAFEAQCREAWWPAKRDLYPYPEGKPQGGWSADQWRAAQIHYPPPTPLAVVADHPAHLHINLLPRLQGVHMGRPLIATWLEAAADAGAKRVHLGCNSDNHRALRFYESGGWERIEVENPGATVWMGRTAG